jgi:hypothetical protein
MHMRAHALVARESLVAPFQPDDMVEHCDMHTSTQGPTDDFRLLFADESHVHFILYIKGHHGGQATPRCRTVSSQFKTTIKPGKKRIIYLLRKLNEDQPGHAIFDNIKYSSLPVIEKPPPGSLCIFRVCYGAGVLIRTTCSSLRAKAATTPRHPNPHHHHHPMEATAASRAVYFSSTADRTATHALVVGGLHSVDPLLKLVPLSWP